MKKINLLFMILSIATLANAQPTGEIQRLLSTGSSPSDQTGLAVSIDGNLAVVGSPYEDIAGSNSGAAYIYYYNGEEWVQLSKLTASDGAADDYFGYSVGISGNTVIVGAYLDDHSVVDAGSAYIFQYSDGVWSQYTKLIPASTYAQDRFGFSVAIDGDYAIIGATYDDNQGQNSGTAFIFYNNAGTWQEQTILTASDGEPNKYFGTGVDISGNYAIVGNYFKGTNQEGAAYVFKNNAGTWSQSNKLTALDAAANDHFGVSVAISGEYAIVGSEYNDGTYTDQGAAYFFKNVSENWTQCSKFIANDAVDYLHAGYSVDISGDYAVVGAYWDSHILNKNGSSYILFNNAGTWEQIAKAEPSDSQAAKYFGCAVGISGENIISGAYGDNTLGAQSGACYFNNQNLGGANNWGDAGKFKSTTGKLNDKFGNSVAISGDYAIVGVIGDNTNGTSSGSIFMYHYNGTDWDLLGNFVSTDIAINDNFGCSVSISGDYAIIGAYGKLVGGLTKGAAYIFHNNAGTWSQYAKLIALDGATNDMFGYSVGLSGDYAIIGAQGKTTNTGAAYVFHNNAGTWSQMAKLTASDQVMGDYFGCSVSISGDYAAIGAYSNDDNGSSSGSAYIFYNNAGTWEQDQKILASDAAMLDYFGYSVSISGNYAAVGAYGNDDNGSSAGSAYIFYNNAGTWEQAQKIVASDAAASDMFGRAVSISGNNAVVGAHLDINPVINAGSAYLFSNNAGTWGQTSKFISSDNLRSSAFGHSVCIDGNNAIFGANNSPINGAASGAAYIFGQTLPVVSSHPADITAACVYNTSDFTVSGNGISDYQWQISTNSGGLWTDISEGAPYTGTQTSTLSVYVSTSMDNYLFRCLCSNILGSTTSSSAALTIETEDPVITSTQTDKTVNANSSCQALLPDYTTILTATDNCDANLTITQSPVAGTTISGTTNTVTLTATDDVGNFAQSSFNVNVVDNAIPVITSSHTNKEVSGNSSCQAALPDYTTTLTATDNCDASISATQSPIAGTTISGTTNTVTLTATDDAGNFAQVSFNVSIIDNTAPEITSTLSDKTVDANSMCQASLPDYTGTVTATDACDASLEITQSPTIGTTISGTANTVTMTVTDDTGNFSQVSFNVAVVDNTNPVITSTHNNQTVNASSSCQASLPDYTGSVTATDNCDVSLTISQIPTSGTTISGTSNTVTLKATDDDGNYSEVSFNVDVIDITNPVITASPTNQQIDADPNCFIILPDFTNDVTATDNCDASVTITQSPIAGTTLSSHVNTITMRATDDAGNYAQATFTVTIHDVTSPEIISSPSDKILSPDASCQIILPDYTGEVIAADNCDPFLTINQDPAAGTIVSGTVNTITITVNDDDFNSVQATFNVEVVNNDNTNPVITSIHNDQTVDAGESCQVVLPDYTSSVVVTDNCDESTSITQFPLAGTTISGASNTVTLTATDDAGNFSDVSFNIEVVDNINPVITSIHNDQTVSDESNCQASLLDYTSTLAATDNCDASLTISQSPLSGTIISGSSNLVTLMATDDNGNYAQASFNVAVQDNTNPVITSSQSDQAINAVADCQVSLPDYTGAITATDNCDVNLVIAQVPEPGILINGLTNNVSITVTDGTGNFVQTSFNVEVIDNINPELTCINDITKTLAEGETFYTVSGTEFNPTQIADNCAIASIINDFNNAETLANAEIPAGTNTITWTVTDIAGNYSECSFDVTVNTSLTQINDFTAEGISIYPNPVSTFLKINSPMFNVESIIILDITGKVMAQSKNVSTLQTIDFSNYSTGVYFIKIQTEKNIFISKIIKE